MKNKSLQWELLHKSGHHSKDKAGDIINILLENRGLKTDKEKEEFLDPIPPEKISVAALGISEKEISKAILRIKKAIKNKEEIVIYGDYDADGVCATAILWECLYSLTKSVRPYIPNRFEEGYGANSKSIENLKSEFSNFKLLITVDNGIVAYDAVDKANDLGIDVIITDHHQKGEKLLKAAALIHTDKISGSGIAWVFAREIEKVIGGKLKDINKNDGLELAAIGTIADQMPLLGPNRSFAKYGLEVLNSTKRLGLIALFEESAIKPQPGGWQTGTYDVNFVIAPRINAMGRLEHAIDSLRLLCTTNNLKARELADFIGRTNRERQRIVDEVVLHTKGQALRKIWKGAIVLAHGSYHEGVIGLAASKLVEEFYRPAIVLSLGKDISKASARSVSGFNIIESIRMLDEHILGGGGHPMAAGFSIESEKIDIFIKKYEEITAPLLTEDILTKKLKIDMELGFENIDLDLAQNLEVFEPTGIGNSSPVFTTSKVSVVDARTVGKDARHLQLVLQKGDRSIKAIAFGRGDIYPKLISAKSVDIAYNLAIDSWKGNFNLQLKVKDIKIH